MTTTSELVLLETAERVATVTLNRPQKLNAFDYAMAEKMLAALEQAAGDQQVRCVVVTGAGRGFCAGGDISAMASGGAALGGEQMDPVARLRHEEEVSRLLHEMPKPTIAMVNGAAAGAGLSIALACDIRIAAASARFGTAFVRVGFSGDFGGIWMLQRLVGPAKARELYFTAELIDAREAERIGLVNRTVPDDRLREETLALAGKIADGPPIALARMKQNLNLGLTSDFSSLLDAEAEGQVMTGLTQDHQNAVRAFLDKRPAVFEGR